MLPIKNEVQMEINKPFKGLEQMKCKVAKSLPSIHHQGLGRHRSRNETPRWMEGRMEWTHLKGVKNILFPFQSSL